MPTRLPALDPPPIAFAHRGARAHAPENTVEAFALALKLGATGLETDVWVTADGVAILDHDGVVGRRPRRRPIAEVARAELPEHVPDAAALVALMRRRPPRVASMSRTRRPPGPCSMPWGPTIPPGWPASGSATTTTTCSCPGGPWPPGPAGRLDPAQAPRPGARAPRRPPAERGIDAVNLHHTDWSAGLVTLYHRFGVRAWGWDAQHVRVLDGLFDMGIDALFSDHVDRMADSLARALA